MRYETDARVPVAGERVARGARRRLSRLSVVAVAVCGLLASAVAAAAVPPTVAEGVETFEYTKNMHPLGFSERVPEGTGLGDVNSDIAFWGNYAFQGNFNGFRIVDVTSPANPVEVGSVHHTCLGGQGDVIVWGDILVRSWDGNVNPGGLCQGVPAVTGLTVFDISDVTNPVAVSSVDTPCGSHTATGVPDPANDRLLVYNSPSGGGCPGIDIVEIPLSAPEDAGYQNFLPAGRSCHDTGVILGDAMLAACAGGNGTTVFSMHPDDGGTLDEPVLLHSTATGGVGIGHSAAFTWDGEVLIIGHEPGGGTQARCQETTPEIQHTMFFLDARTGEPLGEWVLPRKQGPTENCTIHNYNVVPTDKAYVVVSGNYQAGISVVDFTDPANAYEFAYADPAPLLHPSGNPNQIFVGGSWSAHWYNGHIYDADIRRGLFIWKLSDPRVAGAQRLTHLNPQTQDFTIEKGPAFGRVAQGRVR
jgi:hypothetical protein